MPTRKETQFRGRLGRGGGVRGKLLKYLQSQKPKGLSKMGRNKYVRAKLERGEGPPDSASDNGVNLGTQRVTLK